LLSASAPDIILASVAEWSFVLHRTLPDLIATIFRASEACTGAAFVAAGGSHCVRMGRVLQRLLRRRQVGRSESCCGIVGSEIRKGDMSIEEELKGLDAEPDERAGQFRIPAETIVPTG
jgi:hypothetical protein